MSETAEGLLILAGIPLILLVIFVVIIARQTRPVRLQPVSGGHAGHGGTVQVWAKVGRPSTGGWSGENGRLVLTPTELVWHGESGQVWRTPYQDVVVEAVRGAGLMSNARIDLQVGDTGVWQLVVSDDPIRASNDFQRLLRHGAVARQVCDLMVSRGARRA